MTFNPPEEWVPEQSSGQEPLMAERGDTVSQDDEPCRLHAYHSPRTVFNERHHVFPKEYQIDIWGEVRDKEVWSICSTSHNTVHGALRAFLKTGKWPEYAVGATRDLAEEAIRRMNEAKAGL